MELPEVTAAPKQVQIGDTTYIFGRLTLRDWGELEQAALEFYRKEYLRSRLDMADMLRGELTSEEWRAQVIDETMALTKRDLPRRKGRVMQVGPDGEPLENEDGSLVYVVKTIDYAVWWFHETLEGRLHVAYLSLR